MLDDVPWLRDHKMGPDVLIPGAGLATMAIEAMFQKHCALNPEKTIESSNDLAYQLRNVRFDRALVVEEGKATVILLTLTKFPGSKDWHEFRISTTNKEDVDIDHCFGLVRVIEPIDDRLTGCDMEPLRQPQPFTLWYKAQREAGMGFGPSFKKVTSLEAISGERSCRAMVDLTPPPSKWDPQSYYPFHPAVLDACLQVAMPANASNERSLVKDVIVPGIVNDAIINRVPRNMREGLAVARSGYTGRGRPDQAKSIISDISVYDPATGAVLMKVNGLNYVKLDVMLEPDPHTLNHVVWQPDVTLLTQDQLVHLAAQQESPRAGKLDTMINLVAHKKPMLNVLEVNLDEEDATSVWFETHDMSPRLAYVQYDLASPNAETLVVAQSQWEQHRHTAFHLASLDKESLGLTTSVLYDLVILKASRMAHAALDDVLSRAKPLLSAGAFALLVELAENAGPLAPQIVTGGSESDQEAFEPPTLETRGSFYATSGTPSEVETTSSSAPSVASGYQIVKNSHKARGNMSDGAWCRVNPYKLINGDPEREGGFDTVLKVTDHSDRHDSLVHYLCRNDGASQFTSGNVAVVSLAGETLPCPETLQQTLEAAGWTVTQHGDMFHSQGLASLPSDVVILVVDELSSPVLANIDSRQWQALKSLVASGHPLLWVTKGSQYKVTEPNNALVHGLFRVARREDDTARLATLDVESSNGPATAWAVDRVMKLIADGETDETEFAERDGVLHVQRIVPDGKLNAFKRAEVERPEPVVRGLHATDVMVQIRAEKVGSLELTWCENHASEMPVAPGSVEVEVMAVGVNFKVGGDASTN